MEAHLLISLIYQKFSLVCVDLAGDLGRHVVLKVES